MRLRRPLPERPDETVLPPGAPQEGNAQQQADADGEHGAFYPERAPESRSGPVSRDSSRLPTSTPERFGPKTPACMKFHPKWTPIASQSRRVKT